MPGQAMIQNPVPWPGGAKCACCITFDMDADSLIHLEHPKDGYRRASAISMLQYGPEVAVPRILETYRRLGLKQTFFIPAWCMETYPRTVEAILEGGHEIGHHGYLHENPVHQSREEQAMWMDSSIEVIRRMTGQHPRGWRAPLYNFSNHSADLLIERGFRYDASLMGDDNPYIVDGKSGSFVELPSHWGLDDWPQYVQSMDLGYMMPIRSPKTGWDPFAQEFEAAYRSGASGCRLCTLLQPADYRGGKSSRNFSKLFWNGETSGSPGWKTSQRISKTLCRPVNTPHAG